MRVMWTTTVNSSLSVQFGVSKDSLDRVSKSVATTYTINDMCGSIAKMPEHFMNPGFLHDAVMTELPASTTFYYRVGSEESGWSELFRYFFFPREEWEN